jgi:hypothetical protein
MRGGCGVAVGRHEKVTAGAVNSRVLISTPESCSLLTHHRSDILSHQRRHEMGLFVR